MFGTLIIVFREVIEAGLIIGIVLAATRGVAGRGRQVALGIGGGLSGAAVVALFAGEIADAFAGAGQELFNAGVLIVAVAMLCWHTVWMARHGRTLSAELRDVGLAVRGGRRPLTALAVVIGIAVLREGAEVVLFLYGIAISGGSSTAAMLAGGIAGAAMAGGLTWLTHAGLVRLPTRHLFAVIFWLVAFLAAGMAAQAAFWLQAAGLMPTMAGTVWDSSGLLSEGSIVGRVLHTLVGYTDRPSVLQLLAYAATLLGLVVLSRLLSPPMRRA